MSCQLQLNVFCTFDMKDIKFTGIYMTSLQRGQNAFMQVLLVAGGSKRVGHRGSECPTSLEVLVWE